MKQFFNSNPGFLRLIGILEGSSLLLLAGIAVPAKHIFGNPSLVRVIGPVHGVLFLLFVINTLSVGVQYQWRSATTWKVLLACLIPFGTFYIDRTILKKMQS